MENSKRLISSKIVTGFCSWEWNQTFIELILCVRSHSVLQGQCHCLFYSDESEAESKNLFKDTEQRRLPVGIYKAHRRVLSKDKKGKGWRRKGVDSPILYKVCTTNTQVTSRNFISHHQFNTLEICCSLGSHLPSTDGSPNSMWSLFQEFLFSWLLITFYTKKWARISLLWYSLRDFVNIGLGHVQSFFLLTKVSESVFLFLGQAPGILLLRDLTSYQ